MVYVIKEIQFQVVLMVRVSKEVFRKDLTKTGILG